MSARKSAQSSPSTAGLPSADVSGDPGPSGGWWAAWPKKASSQEIFSIWSISSGVNDRAGCVVGAATPGNEWSEAAPGMRARTAG